MLVTVVMNIKSSCHCLPCWIGSRPVFSFGGLKDKFVPRSLHHHFASRKANESLYPTPDGIKVLSLPICESLLKKTLYHQHPDSLY